ncbi:MAG: hypothetical protein KGO53_07930 [Alphaproteobacteria bacterium]|nr:hypothetical protein [Alphaproteobacteria bacterium]
MKKTFIFAVAASAILMSGAAFANDYNGSTYGTVVSLDRVDGSISLANGDSFNVVFPDELRHIRVGEKVQILFDNGNAYSVSRG